MKDRKTIIESGMLEMYLLGLLPDEQITALEKMLSEDAELATIYAEIEQDFENVSFENAVQPPDFIKEDLFDSIRKEYDNVKTLPKEEAFQENLTRKPQTFLWIAASLATIFLVSAFWMFTQWNAAKDDLQITQQELNDIKSQIKSLQGDLQNSQLLADVVKDPNTVQYALKGNDKIPGGFATAYINHEDKSAIVNVQKLPTLSSDKTYQMWADVEGEMINMGVIDKSKDVVVLQYIDEAESLNITIEPAGGSDHATVTQLVTNVYL
ncbi:anti-sigma-K factor rskA [Kordia sp. SMS9]|uniref:anti-sigma factor n=1 Tax=Kordia sp. SMS9 TaxID=2282170 RepID=UPI000E0E01C2|nr:anti-sigma factor [Kordia sp. SMS9]AXG71160.1 anti-sigma-K factor rskA [Kordia sp. SMS9]